MLLFTQVAFGGDQLTVERSRNAQERRVNSDDPVDALQGLEPFAADWHAEANFLQVTLILCSAQNHFPMYICTSSRIYNCQLLLYLLHISKLSYVVAM